MILFLLACAACAGRPKGYTFTLRGDFIHVDTAMVRVYFSEGGVEKFLSTPMRDGKFELSGTLPEPGCYKMRIGDRVMDIVLDGTDMFWPSDYEQIDADYLKGSPAVKSKLAICQLVREAYQEPVKRLVAEKLKAIGESELTQEEEAELEQLSRDGLAELRTRLSDYIKSHAGELYMPVFIREQVGTFGYEWGKEGYDALTVDNQNSQPGRALKACLDNLAATEAGTSFPPIALQTSEGKTVERRFDDGCVYVIDFWASWCGPCRAMIPQLKAIYADLRNEPVRFVSVSLDAKRAEWIAANGEEGLPWESYWLEENFEAEIVRKLNIEAIPFIVVLNKEGKIAAKNVRDKKLVDELKKLLNEDTEKQ